jgi:hypothetical protein
LNDRPITAAAEATSLACGDSCRARASTASPSVSGTAALRTIAPDCRVSEAFSIAAMSSSMCSGMPSLRWWMARATRSGTGWPSTALTTLAVCTRSSRGSRISSASRCEISRVRSSPSGSEGSSSSLRYAAATSISRDPSRPARWPSTSRLSGSAQCRSSSSSSTGPVPPVAVIRSTRSWISRRRR